jgi:anti-anti-sigma factor
MIAWRACLGALSDGARASFTRWATGYVRSQVSSLTVYPGSRLACRVDAPILEGYVPHVEVLSSNLFSLDELVSSYSPDLEGTQNLSGEGAFTAWVECGRPAVVRVNGELDLATVPRLLSTLERLDGDVDVDCSGLHFIDAAGLGAFVKAHHACAARGARLVVVDPSPAVVRLLRLVELDTVLHLRRNGETP